MKKNLSILFYTLTAILIFSSCSDDDETILSDDCYITSFTLGNVKRLVHTTTKDGKDRTYYVTYDASGYAMHINQLTGKIANTDSLPVGSRTQAILATVNSSGSLMYRYADDVSENWLSYSSSDSIDFSHTLIFRVTSADGFALREYEVKLNVHQQEGDEFSWNRLTSNSVWHNATYMKSIIWNNKVWLYTADDQQNISLFTSDVNDGQTWQNESISGCENALIRSITDFNGRLLMSCTDGSIIESTDGKNWTNIPNQSGETLYLLTASQSSIYALGNNNQKILRSQNAADWTEEVLDDSPAFLPSQDITAISYTQENGNERVILGGNRSATAYPDDKTVMIWSKVISPYLPENNKWSYFVVAPDNYYICPPLKHLTILSYDKQLVALGGPSVDGTYKALEELYVSPDNGITWKKDPVYPLPESIANSSAAFTASTDDDNHIWLIVGGEVWKGRLNRLGFAQQ